MVTLIRILMVAGLLAAPTAAFAEAPDRIGNIWGWQNHQPTETEVLGKEVAAGVAPSATRESSEAATLHQIYRQLIH
jgi:hypothetical protein